MRREHTLVGPYVSTRQIVKVAYYCLLKGGIGVAVRMRAMGLKSMIRSLRVEFYRYPYKWDDIHSWSEPLPSSA